MIEIDMKQFSHCYCDLPYTDGSSHQVLDLIMPEPDGEKKPPLVVYIHGGGWIHGSKREHYFKNIFKIVSQGYALATLEYRFSDEALWPAQLYDVKAAIRFLRANADKYGYEADRLLAWGNSAGAHLCQMLAVTAGKPEFEDLSMGNPDASSAVQSIVSWYGISDMLTMDLHCDWVFHGEHTIDTYLPESHESLLFGCSVEDKPEEAMAASPVSYVNETFPPALFQHGTRDRIVPHYQTVEMVNRIVDACGRDRVILELFDGADHGDPMIKCDENILRVLKYIDEFYGVTRDYASVVFPEIAVVE